MSETSTGLELVELLVRFARRLRDEGVAVGPGDTEVYCATAAALDPTDLVDLQTSHTLYTANAAVVRASNQMLGTLLDVFDDDNNPAPHNHP